MKLCKDKNCKRLDQKLRPSQFPRNRQLSDGRGIYCRECSSRRTQEYRERRREILKAQKIAKPVVIKVERKPNVLAEDKVRQAIARGAKTIELIQRRTKLNYDKLGEVLAAMTFDSKTLRIQRLPDGKREFVIAA